MPEDESALSKCLFLISHENFHAWLGLKMKIEPPQGGLQWFFEGFNDFYGLYLANKSNLITNREYIDIYNLYMKEYFLSPLRLESNQAIKDNFRMRSDFAQIAQIRGHFLAKNLRDKFNVEAENKFDNAIRDLFYQYKKEQWRYLTDTKIDSVFRKHLGDKEWSDFKNVILSGKPIEFSRKAFSPYAELADVELDAPDFGFNLRKFAFENIICDIDVNSNAFYAGLRNGNKIKYHNLNYKMPNDEVMIAIDNNGTEKIIKFKPKMVKKMVPQYVMVKGDVFEKRLRNRHV